MRAQPLRYFLAEQATWWEPGTKSGYQGVSQGNLVGEVVRRVDGRSVGHPAPQQLGQPFGRQRVEAVERLVEHDEHRVVHERAGQLHALCVAERERVDATVGHGPELERLDDAPGAAARPLLGDPAQPGQVHQVVLDRHGRVEAALLG